MVFIKATLVGNWAGESFNERIDLVNGLGGITPRDSPSGHHFFETLRSSKTHHDGRSI
jgi:hypothetical protein